MKITLWILTLLAAALNMASSSIMEKHIHIPEKILGGVIDIVNKHKPSHQAQATFQQQAQASIQQGNFQQQQSQTQATFPNQGNYQPGSGGYPQHWNPNQNYQGYYSQAQGQGQFAGNGQNFYQPGFAGTQFPQAQYGNYPQGNTQGFQASFGVSSSGNLGLYQGNNNQAQYQVVYPQNGGNQGSNSQPGSTGNYSQGSYVNQGQGSYVHQGQTQGQNTSQGGLQGSNSQSISTGSNHLGAGVQTTGSPGVNGNGPTCVCQAWTKPGEEKTPENTHTDKKD